MNEKIEVMESLVQYIPNLCNGINLYRDNMEQGNLKDAQQILEQIIEGIEWVIKAVSLTRDIYTIDIDITSITSILEEVLEAMKNDDSVLICDLLKYEVGMMLDTWRQVVKSELERLEGKA